MTLTFKKCKLKNLTWLKIGGEADFLYANNIPDLLCASQFAQERKVKLVTIGAGSNILASDGNINALIIKLGNNFSYISLENNFINIGCATLDTQLAKFALENEITGLEFFATIPGTIGGAIAMNAGSYGSTVSMHLDSVKALDSKGKIKIIPTEKMGYKYRGHSLNENLIFLEGKFKIKKGLYKEIKYKMQEMLQIKNSSQPINVKSCGSFFKNPLSHKAWKLIDDSGCKGMKIGDAEVSTKHCNFLINSRHATSNDISLLYKAVKHKVKNCFNIDLELEVIILD